MEILYRATLGILLHEVAASFIADSTSYSRTAPRLVGKNR